MINKEPKDFIHYDDLPEEELLAFNKLLKIFIVAEVWTFANIVLIV